MYYDVSPFTDKETEVQRGSEAWDQAVQSQNLGPQPLSKADVTGPHGQPRSLWQTHMLALKHRIKLVKHLGIFCSLACVALLLKTSSPAERNPSASKPNQINKAKLSRISVIEQNGCQKRVQMNRLISEGIASKEVGTENERRQLISMCSLCKCPPRALWSPVPALLEGTGWEVARHRADHSNALDVMHSGMNPG